ncbi:MAG TPA: hypothetical protein VF721_04395 [Pyrinomonadaceae bacterium]|jgi:hypothetical protein
MSCEAAEWSEYKEVKLWKFPDSDAYFYTTSRMAIDADGAPNAYNEQDTGIDALANAGYPNGRNWRSIIVPDPANDRKAYVQPSGEFKGFFVSKTSLEDARLPVTDYKRYVDSRNVSYLVFPGAFNRMRGTGTLGDIGAAYNLSNNKKSAFIVADIGAFNHELGEVSIGLAEKLGGRDVNPRNGRGAPRGPFVYVVFPKSRFSPKWRVDLQQIQERSDELLAAIGGWQKILECVR